MKKTIFFAKKIQFTDNIDLFLFLQNQWLGMKASAYIQKNRVLK